MLRHLAGVFVAGAALSASLTLAVRAQPGAQSTAFAAITFNKDIAPILWRHCGTCHRPDQLA